LLNQFAADATGRTVLAGPVEATAIGNVLVQAIAMGDVASLSELRSIVRESFSIESFVPQSSQAWTDAQHRIASFA
jgi:rhamnulokinase